MNKILIIALLMAIGFTSNAQTFGGIRGKNNAGTQGDIKRTNDALKVADSTALVQITKAADSSYHRQMFKISQLPAITGTVAATQSGSWIMLGNSQVGATFTSTTGVPVVGKVTTSDPSYTNGHANVLSLNERGYLRVVTQGIQVDVKDAPPTYTDGDQSAMNIDTKGRLRVQDTLVKTRMDSLLMYKRNDSTYLDNIYNGILNVDNNTTSNSYYLSDLSLSALADKKIIGSATASATINLFTGSSVVTKAFETGTVGYYYYNYFDIDLLTLGTISAGSNTVLSGSWDSSTWYPVKLWDIDSLKSDGYVFVPTNVMLKRWRIPVQYPYYKLTTGGITGGGTIRANALFYHKPYAHQMVGVDSSQFRSTINIGTMPSISVDSSTQRSTIKISSMPSVSVDSTTGSRITQKISELVPLVAGTAYIGKTRLTDGTTDAEVVPLGGYNAQAVAIVDGSGNQITSFSGGSSVTVIYDSTITAASMTVTNLNSVANSATVGWQSARVSNVSAKASDYKISVKLTMANTAPANDKAAYVYLCPHYTTDGGTTWLASSQGTTTLPTGSEGASTIASPNNLRLLGVLSYTTQNMVLQDNFLISNAFGNVMPDGFQIIIINYTGAAISASGNSVHYSPIYKTQR